MIINFVLIIVISVKFDSHSSFSYSNIKAILSLYILSTLVNTKKNYDFLQKFNKQS